MISLKRGYELAKFKINQRLRGVCVSDTPWFDEATLAWFKNRLPRARSYLEFGSGGSTMMAARLGVPTISVEGDRYFGQEVGKRLAPEHKVQMLCPPIGMTGLWGVPFPGTPTPDRVRRWRSYIDQPFEVLAKSEQEFPDLFLVDGRFRNACALRAALETKRAGRVAELLFDDYSAEERPTYMQTEEILGAPQRVGRSAIFALGPDNAVTENDINRVIHDFK